MAFRIRTPSPGEQTIPGHSRIAMTLPSHDARTRDRTRVPPGQTRTEKWPVLHYGNVPAVDLAAWRFEIGGLVEAPRTWTFEELMALPQADTLCDIHCVTRWSRLDNRFTGIPVQALLREVRPTSDAAFVLVHSEQGFSTNLPLADLDRPGNLLAALHDGRPLTPDHGWPLRLVVPHLYFWKSAKWVRGFEFLPEDEPGFWERNGYHMRGDPWKEERYGGFDIEQWMINRFRNASKGPGR